MPSAFHHRWPAMGTFFEAFLVGEESEQARALAESAEDESRRLEAIYSRFDPTAEIARVNRAPGELSRASPELGDLLRRCDDARARTGGHFDITLGTGSIAFDDSIHAIRLSAGTRLDLGAVAKGEALDRIAEIWQRMGVTNALLNAGTSSILAIGNGPSEQGWPIDVRDPFREDGPPITRQHLRNTAFSCSATMHPGQSTSDIQRPSTTESLTTPTACVVLAPTAAVAEILSTALLVAGRQEAVRQRYWRHWIGIQVAWIDENSALAWLTETT